MAVMNMDAVNTFEAYPTGTYLAEIMDWELGESKIKKTKQVLIKCELAGAGKYTEFLPLTEKAVWKVANLITATGIKLGGKLDTDSAMFQQVLKSLIGRKLYITLELDSEYNNNKSTKYARDIDQEEEEFVSIEDSPKWAE